MPAGLTCLALLAAAGLMGAADPPPASGKILLRATSVDLDNTTKQIIVVDAVVTQGTDSVSADRAEADSLDFENSRWVFIGNVHIRSAIHGNLQSDRATVEYRNNAMTRAVATGAPAEFEQTQSPNGVLAHGHANSIEYEVASGTVRLTGDPWLTNGRAVMSAAVITYDVNEKTMKGAADDATGKRVDVTILPKQDGSRDAKP